MRDVRPPLRVADSDSASEQQQQINQCLLSLNDLRNHLLVLSWTHLLHEGQQLCPRDVILLTHRHSFENIALTYQEVDELESAAEAEVLKQEVSERQ